MHWVTGIEAVDYKDFVQDCRLTKGSDIEVSILVTIGLAG